MNKKIKNIFNLTKIVFKNSFENKNLINKKTNKINKKSIFLWLMIIVVVTISYLSFEVISYLVNIGQPVLFLNIFFLILMIIIIFQTILASINVYFFSKDLELILPMPIKMEELLISKFNAILINIYLSELIFALIPLIIYGICTYANLLYYFYLILILLIFPILPILFISIIMMIFMKLSKFIKNKDVFQIIITLIFIILIFLLEFFMSKIIINKMGDNLELSNENAIQIFDELYTKLNTAYKYFLEINPSINLLKNYNKLNSIFNLFKIIFIDLLFFILFIFIGKKYYLKNILKNNNYYLNKKKKNNIEKKIKKLNVRKSYIKKEFKLLFKNPTFFMQCIFPILILTISIIIIVGVALPNVKFILTTDFFGNQIDFSMDLETICLTLQFLQVLFTMSNISITAISREGKNAIYMKYLPVDFYKQFIYKNIPQIFVNNILIIIILILVKFIFPEFNLIYLFLTFIIANLFNIINSELMLVVDLYKPNLNWKSDYEAVKSNNKIFQYVLTILIILLLVYFNNIFSELNLNTSCLLIILILIILILIINKIIKLNIKKLFKKIN